MLNDSFKPRHYRIHLTSSRCTLVSIACNLLLAIILLHSWSEPCEHSESTHLSEILATKQAAYSDEIEVNARPAAQVAEHSFHLTNRKLAGADSTPSKLGETWTPPAPSPLLAIKNDLSLNQSFKLSEHEFEWKYCSIGGGSDTIIPQALKYCEQTAEVEQKYQMSWFGNHVVAGSSRPFPKYLDCIHLPPVNYQWPTKWPELPATKDAVHWENLRVSKVEELIVFNQATPKNLYHFNAPKYDLDALTEMDWAARHIPFGPKVRLMLDVGAGGGSLGLLLKRKYDVQVLSTVFADWPYCEYISERGGLCMLVDVMEPMPFAKFTYDVLHVSWVYHGQQPDELIIMYNEINRILRPGGYLWMRGGWARVQVDTLMGLLVTKLGYQVLVQKQIPKGANKHSFGENLPYELDWDVILVKPISAVSAAPCQVEPIQRKQIAEPSAAPEASAQPEKAEAELTKQTTKQAARRK